MGEGAGWEEVRGSKGKGTVLFRATVGTHTRRAEIKGGVRISKSRGGGHGCTPVGFRVMVSM